MLLLPAKLYILFPLAGNSLLGAQRHEIHQPKLRQHFRIRVQFNFVEGQY